VAVTEKTFLLAGTEAPVGSTPEIREALAAGTAIIREVTAGDAVEVPAGLFQLNLVAPADCEIHLQRFQDGRWLNVIGRLPEPPEHGDPRGPRAFRPEPVRLPACSVRLDAPGILSPGGFIATLVLIG
jgi:hypothetical protein